MIAMTHSPLNVKRWALPALAVAMLLSGCSAVQLRGVPANRLPRWLLGEPRANRQPINLIRLRQDPPAVYQLGPRDILGIYIEGVLGNDEQPPPVHFPGEGGRGMKDPAIGYPIPIREDGTLALPLLPAPLKISGMTLTQAEAAIKEEYIKSGILAVGRDRIIVTIIRKRTYQVLVVREDVGSQQGAQGVYLAGPSKRGSAYAIDLNAYENDVMHALTESGGMPGLDAKNEILILRGTFADAQSRSGLIDEMVNAGPYAGSDSMQRRNPNVIRIPLRSEPGRPLQQLTEDDIILATGDVIFIETRERDVFYTGGLIQGREIPLPRDYDLDVLAAISLAGGTVSSGLSQGSLARQGNAIGGGGSGGIIPPTQIVIVRKLPDGSTVPIKINLNRALVDPTQRILIQPGDLVLLQYTPFELAANVVLGSVSFSYFLNRIQ
jgi:protein involved in polysaccharide export with SLBB domain